jgi:hypothetical protein
MNSTLTGRELEIGERLRTFRESKRIPRTSFALSIGIGGERMASYESGRVCLPFDVYQAINQKYFLNPIWLATGEGPPSAVVPYDLGPGEAQVPARAQFSEAYDSYLKEFCTPAGAQARACFQQLHEIAKPFITYMEEHPEFELTPEEAREMRKDWESFDKIFSAAMKKWMKPHSAPGPEKSDHER